MDWTDQRTCGDVSKLLTVKRHSIIRLKLTTEPDYPSVNTAELWIVRSWKTDNLFSMSKSILTPKWLVLGSLELPLTSSLASAFRHLPSVVCRRIQGTGGARDELDDAAILTILADEWRRNGRGMADKRRPKPCSQTLKRWPTAAVNTTELWTGLQSSDDGDSLRFSSPTMAE